MSDTEALRKEAKRAYKARDFTTAAQAYVRLLDLTPAASAEARVADQRGYAAALANLNRLDEAAVQWEQIVAAMPNDAGSRQKLAGFLARLGRHDAAAEQLNEAILLEPDAADNYWRLAAELRTLGREDEARGALQRCLKLDPGNAHAQIMELEQVYLTTSERDGQAAEIEFGQLAAGEAFDLAPPEPASAPRPVWYTRRWLIVAEAIGLFAIALWLRNQLG